MTLEELAREASSWFETARRATGDTESGPREDGEPYVRLRSGHPEWLRDIVYTAHDDMLPDDWRYSCIRDAVEWIADGRDEDESGEFADSQVDVYTGARLAWLASHLSRQNYVDDAIEEFGSDAYSGGVVNAIGLGQYAEASEVFGYVVDGLRSRLEELEEDENDADD